MKQRSAEILLASVIVARATSLLFSRLSMRSLGPFTLMGLRFTLAFAVLLLLFWKRFRGIRLATVARGFALGGTFFAVMTAELYGLRATDSSTTSFLENTAVVWVPLLAAALHRQRPSGKTLLSAGVTLAGVALLTLGKSSFHLGLGELLCLLASVLYACAILLTAKLSREDDPLVLGILQVGFLGLLGVAGAFLFETPRLPQGGAEWGMILALALVCSCFGFTLQPVAQRYVSAERAGTFCALNPLTAAVLGAVFLRERLGAAGVVGAALILTGILIQNRGERQRRPKLARAGT
ncbi:MAG: DMT family transporter [Oscillospiraceae bacterium]|nr:DMT family transporter [Oscillospiraceae bacterium]